MDNLILVNSNDLRLVIQEEMEKVFKQHLSNERSSYDDDKWLTREEVCDILRITYTTLWRMERRGEICPRKIGRRSLYSKKEVDKLINN